ncbi:MAG: DNA repair protein RecO [Solirubrobacteraceae bacterium]
MSVPAPGTRIGVDAIVLRSMRYREADRILHAVTPDRGRVSAIARGVRRARSKLAGRLEPLSVVRLELIVGRGDLHTVVGADTLAVHHRILTDGTALDHAQRACHAVDRVCVPDEPAPRVHGLLRTLLARIDADPTTLHEGVQLAFRLKLLYALGLQPALDGCVHCGRVDGLVAFDDAAGGLTCAACRTGAAAWVDPGTPQFMRDALALPLASAPIADPPTVRQVQRAIVGLAQHHLGVDLRSEGAG